MEKRIFNFSAGPAVLPLPVLEQAQRELLVYPGAGASILEISHRSKTFEAVLQQAKDNIRALLQLPDTYKILFCQGGASLQFTMVAMNLLRGDKADYIHTGSWAAKAIEEGKRQGTVHIAWNGKPENFVRVPRSEELQCSADAVYLHFTSNETIQGIEFPEEPASGDVPLVCDASSDFLSRPIAVEKYGLIYAGAQKNVGPAGVAVVIIRDDLLERSAPDLPPLLSYRTLAEHDSLYNTPPCFAIYIIALVTQWLRDSMGGLTGIAEHNRRKAALLYDVIDQSGGFYRGHAQPSSRSLMNVTFRLPNEELEATFVKEAKSRGLDGLKGHRSVGGCRASIYNAMPYEGCVALAEFMKEFQRKNG